MKTAKCPKCGRKQILTGKRPALQLTCECGHVETVYLPPLYHRLVLVAVVGFLGLVVIVPIYFSEIRPFLERRGIESKMPAECLANLQKWYALERAYWEREHQYTTSLARVGFSPEMGNRYAYFAGPEWTVRYGEREISETAQGVSEDTDLYPSRSFDYTSFSERLRREVGLTGPCPQCDITLACAGIRIDSTVEVRTISTADRTDAEGKVTPKGQVRIESHVND